MSRGRERERERLKEFSEKSQHRVVDVICMLLKLFSHLLLQKLFSFLNDRNLFFFFINRLHSTGTTRLSERKINVFFNRENVYVSVRER